MKILWSFRPHQGIIFFNMSNTKKINGEAVVCFRPHQGDYFFNKKKVKRRSLNANA